MSRKVVSPACILNFPYLREVDTYNKQNLVYSVQGLFTHEAYQKYLNDIRNFIDVHHNQLVDDRPDYAEFAGNKLYRKRPQHPKGDGKHYIINSKCKEFLKTASGTISNRPFVNFKNGESVPSDRDLKGLVGCIVSRPTVFKSMSVVSNILLGVIVLQKESADISQIEKDAGIVEKVQSSTNELDDDILDLQIQEGDKAYIEKVDKDIAKTESESTKVVLQ